MPKRSEEPLGSRMEADVNAVQPQLSDEQWLLISDFFPVSERDPRGGRPKADARRCLEGILWVLRSGARWKDLPRTFPSYVTCWRRFVEWSRAGLWEQAWCRLIDQLDRQSKVDWQEGFADGTFASAKKGAIWSVPRSGARAPSSCSSSTAPVCHWPSTSIAQVPRKSDLSSRC
jgi:transposase